ncbi:hypothetical protein BC332_02463 [Capsicum chinense]|nr:hypothetical protein BC332_02463 [Capsicum chinense]
MKSDLGPSFSLGLSLLGSIKEYQQVVNFVPGSFDYEFVGFDENISKRRNDPHTMKKLQQKPAKKGKKKESGYKKRGSCSSASKAPTKRRRIVKAISRDNLPKMFEICSNVDTKVVMKESNNIPRMLNWRVVAVRPQYNQFMSEMFSKCSYSNIVPTAEELKKLDLPLTSFASDYPGTSSMPSSTGNPD